MEEQKKTRIILRGKEYYYSKIDFIEASEEVEPDLPRIYYVVIGGKQYPVKQVVDRILSVGKSTFTTQDAIRILKKVGFKILIKSETK